MNESTWLPWSDGAGRRVLLVLAVVAMVVASAGCLSMLSDEEQANADASKQTAKVPAEADMLMNVDMAVFEDEETNQLMTELSEQENNAQGMEDIYTEFRSETGLDLDELQQITVFGWAPDGMSTDSLRTEEEVGFLLDAEWDAETIVDVLGEDSDMELVQTEYAGEEVLWEPANPDAHADPFYVGVHDDGQFVMGTKAAVTASLDVSYNGADPASGALLDAFEDTPEGLISYATTHTSGTDAGGQAAPNGLKTMTGAYSTEDGDIMLESRLVFEEAQQVDDFKQSISFFAEMYASDPTAQEQQLIDNIETSTEDSTLVVTWSTSVDTLVELSNE